MKLKSYISIVLLFTSTLFLSGCWDHEELPAFAYVQAVAIDVSEEDENKIILTTQFIKPAPKIGSAGGGVDKSFVNIETEGDTIFEAIRDITMHLGRKAQWSHMRMVLISSEIAEKRNIGKLLEFYYRDHEVRMLVNVGIMEGKAKDYLDHIPFIENTISQQIKEVQKAAHDYSSKTAAVNLMTLGRDLKSESKTAKLPYFRQKGRTGEPNVSGLAVIDDGKFSGTLTPTETEGLLMLTNEYHAGIIELPCTEPNKDLIESVEVMESKSDMKSTMKDGSVHVDGSITIHGNVGELECSLIDKSDKVMKFNKKVAKAVKSNVEKSIHKLQEEKTDLIGIGNEIFRKNPEQWNKIKKQWPELFSEATFDIKVKVNIDNSGADIGIPFWKE